MVADLVSTNSAGAFATPVRSWISGPSLAPLIAPSIPLMRPTASAGDVRETLPCAALDARNDSVRSALRTHRGARDAALPSALQPQRERTHGLVSLQANASRPCRRTRLG